MLKLLRRIVQEFNAMQNMAQALPLLVQRINEALETDSCSIYLTDNDKSEYVLTAAKGITEKQIGKFRLKVGEGLVGLVGERGEPINIDNAPKHEYFAPLPHHNDNKYHAFLGVPIMYQRELLGVLIIQRQEAKRFDEEEEAFLVTLATQLASTIAHAKATGALRLISRRKKLAINRVTFTGVPGAPGVAIGIAMVMFPPADLDAVPERQVEDSKRELKTFNAALQATRAEIQKLNANLAKQLSPAERELFDAYSHMLDNSSLIKSIKKLIRQNVWAQGAVKQVIKQHIAQFEAMDDLYLRERATDLKDIGQRILFYLQSGEKQQRQFPKQTILVGEEVTPAMLAEVPEDRLAGVVSTMGSANSHIAILARALGIPTVMGASGMPVAQLENRELILDGYYGEVYVSPSREIRREFKQLLAEEKALDKELESLRDLPAETKDGYAVSLYVNTGLAADVGRSLSVGSEGVGLYRTEVPFMVRDRFPTEEEQRVIYRQLLNAFAPRPVMMRTLDVGGDKALPYFPLKEDNPFLGWRGVRITLDHPEIFLVQARAMLRANIDLGNLHIMFPMITSISEIDEVLRLLNQAYEELKTEKFNVTKPAVGVMLEVPSAIYQAREIAKRVDFLSVGSNDLTQYILAVDRNNARVAELYHTLHPAILQALMMAVKGAHKEKKHISICGEMAGDPTAVILLLAMGFDTLSMSATRLPRIKWVIRNSTMERAKELLHDVLKMDDPIEIRCHMELALEETGLGGLIRAGK